MPIESENSNPSYQEQKMNFFVIAKLKLIHIKEVCETSFSVIISQGVYCQSKAKTLTKVIKNKTGYLFVSVMLKPPHRKKFV